MLNWRFIVPALVLAAVIASLPFVLNLPDEAAEIVQNRIETLANRPVQVTGETRIEVFPEPRIVLDGLVLAGNGPGAKPLMTVRRLTAYPRVLSILSGDLEMRRFELEAPRIHAAPDDDGRLNWSTYTAKDFDALSIENPYIGELTFEDGELVVERQAPNESLLISDINGSLDLPRFLASARLRASGIALDRNFALDVSIDEPVNLLFGGSTVVEADLQSNGTRFEGSGTLRTGLSSGFNGEIGLTSPDLPSFIDWIGIETEHRFLPTSIELRSQLAVLQSRASFSGAEMTLDDQRAEGELIFDLSEPGPPIEGTLAFETLSLDRLAAPLSTEQPPSPPEPPLEDPATQTAGEVSETASSANLVDESQAPASPLLSAIPFDRVIDLRISANEMTLAGLTASDVAVTLTVRDGRADIGLGNAGLASGRIAGAVTVLEAEGNARADISLSVQDVRPDQVLGAVSAFGWLGGQVTADIGLRLQTLRTPEIWTGAEGQIILNLADGSFRLPNAVQLVSPGLPGVVGTIAEQSLRRRTRGIPMDRGLLEITLSDGIATLDALDLTGPRGHLSGTGTVTLDDGTFTAAFEARDGEGEDVTGIPIAVSGSLDAPIASADLAALARLFAN